MVVVNIRRVGNDRPRNVFEYTHNVSELSNSGQPRLLGWWAAASNIKVSRPIIPSQ